MVPIKSQLFPDSYLNSKGASPSFHLNMMHRDITSLEKFEHKIEESEDKGCCLVFDNRLCAILGRWWNAHYKWQKRVIHFVEHRFFHAVIIILVLLDCGLVIAELILDFMKIGKICEVKEHNENHEENEKELHRIEIAIEVVHYTSVGLLSFFLLEILVKVVSYGRHWWNPHDKKMEWLDAIIVIVSFIIDVVTIFLTSYYAEIALLFIILRLWRIVRIINSVAQSVRSEDEGKKKHLASNYHQVVEMLIDILENKTILLSRLCVDMTPESRNEMRKKFKRIDTNCRAVLEDCPHPSSLKEVTDMAHHLQDAIENLHLASFSTHELNGPIGDD